MDGLNRALGVVLTPLRLPCGRTLLLSPFTLADLAAEESHHGSLRGPDPEVAMLFAAASGRGLPAEIITACRNARAIFRGGPRTGFADVPHEQNECLRTPEGLAWRLQRSARKQHADLTVSDAYEAVGAFYVIGRIAELYASLDMAVGTRDLRWIRSGGGDGQWRTPWGEQFTTLAEKYGWTFEQISGLTLYQYCIALGAKAPESGTTS